ncbi:hypothetical protein OEZ85_004588 [Tetradesmus obliquus]|uniref:Septin-type G domain-containing protein n=1 Tax=Tetradesmus obliquus TaxID=3088 RepID=A0ABY8UPG0_TETOB|nr:hypothetical protein OEZ85_004588 [Tetradesmus obliquus]
MSDFELLSGPSSPRSCRSMSSLESSMNEAAAPPPPPAAMAAAAAAAAPSSSFTFTPKLDMRPITTPINLLVCGASSTGKSSFIRACAQMLSAASSNLGTTSDSKAQLPSPAAEAAGIGAAADPHAVLLSGSGAFCTKLPPIVCPAACRELVYTFQDCPGHGSSLNPAAYSEALITFLLQQQEKDYKLLQGGAGGLKALSKSLTCGCLQHSITACIYFLPPHGPFRLDLALMASLAKHAAVLPVVGKADAMTADEAAACCAAVRHMLAEPAEYVPGFKGGGSIGVYRPSARSNAEGPRLPLLLHTRCGPTAAAAAAAAGAEGYGGLRSLLELVAGNEVYGLLDRSWDQFIGFCDAYNAAGRRLQALAAAACQAAVVPAAVDAIGNERLAEQVFDLQEQLQQLETDKEQADDVCLSLERQLQQLKKDKAKADADVARAS